ncbi:hypothetical protein GCM10009549_54510 [Streptomyces thermoalcalitolerans]|uniref:Secreted protein n=1 Tax=Streptomyces thermoalcalitolerans TaxID=65605 RepID=A0ABN1PQ02_9ACTN
MLCVAVMTFTLGSWSALQASRIREVAEKQGCGAGAVATVRAITPPSKGTTGFSRWGSCFSGLL